MSRCFLIFILSGFSIAALGQLNEGGFARWHLRAGGGASFMLSPLHAEPAHYLLELGGNGILAGPFSVRCFVNQRWGFEVQLNKSHPFGGADFRESFYANLQERYSPDYFVRTDFSESKFIQGDKPQITFGVVHQVRNKRWFFHQYLGFGYREVQAYSADVILKRNGSNNYLHYELFPGKRVVNGVVVSGSAGVAYLLYDRVMLQFEAIVSRFDQDFSFTEKTTDMFTLESDSRKIEFTRAFHQLYLSVGISYLVDMDPPAPRKAKPSDLGKGIAPAP